MPAGSLLCLPARPQAGIQRSKNQDCIHFLTLQNQQMPKQNELAIRLSPNSYTLRSLTASGLINAYLGSNSILFLTALAAFSAKMNKAGNYLGPTSAPWYSDSFVVQR